jgi:predicted nuclease of predicted toxin-antitoxin system
MPWLDAVEVARSTPPTKRELKQVLEYRRRKAKPKFYADENFPAVAVRLLRATTVQMITAKEAGLNGHPDENHAAFALKNGCVLLTCDRDYLDEQRFPLVHCPAIVVFDFGSGSSREMKGAFQCLRTMYGSPQFFDKWVKIDAKRDCWSEYWRFLNGTTSRSRYRVHRGRLQEWVET